MAILRSKDGNFYNVPDENLEEFKVAPEKVRETLKKEGYLQGPPKGKKGPKHRPPSPKKGAPSPVSINVFVGGQSKGKKKGVHVKPGKEEGDDVKGYYCYCSCSSCSCSSCSCSQCSVYTCTCSSQCSAYL